MTLITGSLPPELVPYAQALEDFKSETGIRLSLPPLGTGGGGTVLKAEYQDGKPLAVKVIAANDAASRDQALREASILKQVQHAKVYGGGDGLLWQRRTQQTDLFVLAMDFIPGDTLTELIAARGRLAEPVALELAIGIAEELETLHAQHIIHRDVKPDNVMLMKLGNQLQPILVDYGIAKVGKNKKTMRGARAATDGYAPPEQYSGGTDQRADVYALGATLYEMVTGETPCTSLNRDPNECLKPRLSNAKISYGLELVIQIATAYAAQQRFASMRAMMDALRLAQAGDEVALRSRLQALGVLSGGAKPLADHSSALALTAVPPLPPLPLKSATPRPKAPKLPASVRKKVCPYCQEPCQAGEVYCDDCGGALDPEVSVPPQSSAGAVAGSPAVASTLITRTPGPQFVSLLFAHRIILGGPALGWLGKNLLLLGYWFVLAGVMLGARSLSIICGLFGWLPIVCALLFFSLFPLFAQILRHWDGLTIQRRGQTHWLRRSGLLLLGLGGLGGILYWLVSEVAIWHSDWFLAPPPLSILVYLGMVGAAAVLVKGLLA